MRNALLWGSIALLFFAVSLSADEVLLKNGDRISGRVETAENGKLVINTDYAGKLTIKMSEISIVKTETPMLLLQTDKKTSQVNTLDLVNESELNDDLLAINPPAWVYGEGARFKGLINASIEIKEGNSNSEEFDIDGNMEVRRINDRFKLAAEFEYDRSVGNITKNKRWILASYDYFPDKESRWGMHAKRWYYGLTASLEKDELASLRLRTILGGHAGYQFFESKAMNLLLETGPSYVTEDFTENTDDNRYWALGWSLDFDRYLFNDVVQFYHKQTGIAAVSGDKKRVYKTWTGFRFPLFAGFVGSTEVKLEYDDAPADNKEKLDTTYNFKLGYSWD